MIKKLMLIAAAFVGLSTTANANNYGYAQHRLHYDHYVIVNQNNGTIRNHSIRSVEEFINGLPGHGDETFCVMYNHHTIDWIVWKPCGEVTIADVINIWPGVEVVYNDDTTRVLEPSFRISAGPYYPTFSSITPPAINNWMFRDSGWTIQTNSRGRDMWVTQLIHQQRNESFGTMKYRPWRSDHYKFHHVNGSVYQDTTIQGIMSQITGGLIR